MGGYCSVRRGCPSTNFVRPGVALVMPEATTLVGPPLCPEDDLLEEYRWRVWTKNVFVPQEFDIVNMVKSSTKYAVIVNN